MDKRLTLGAAIAVLGIATMNPIDAQAGDGAKADGAPAATTSDMKPEQKLSKPNIPSSAKAERELAETDARVVAGKDGEKKD